MERKILLSFDLDNPADRKVVLEILNLSVVDGQQKLPSKPPGGEGSPKTVVFVPATFKQQNLMDKLKIKWDKSTSKDLASSLISEKLEESDK